MLVRNLFFLPPQISRTLGRLESVATFTEFVKAFSVFGAEMVELAHITGKSQISAPIPFFSTFPLRKRFRFYLFAFPTDDAIHPKSVMRVSVTQILSRRRDWSLLLPLARTRRLRLSKRRNFVRKAESNADALVNSIIVWRRFTLAFITFERDAAGKDEIPGEYNVTEP